MRSYIKKSAESGVHTHPQMAKELFLYDKPIYRLKFFTKDINLDYVIKKIEHLVPKHLTKNFEGIYVGDFQDKNFNALYKDGVIYISNNQDNEEDLLDDIVHEIAHSLEREFHNEIYAAGDLESEFLAKRKTMHYLVDKPTMNMVYYISTDYQAEFDDHIYKELGYDYITKSYIRAVLFTLCNYIFTRILGKWL